LNELLKSELLAKFDNSSGALVQHQLLKGVEKGFQ
jgi:hypothetical protein